MKTTFTTILMVLTLVCFSITYAQNNITPDDLTTLLGEWKGSLTYTDYQTNKPFTMPANVVVSQGKNKNQLLLAVSYPQEAHANSKGKIKISKDGTQLNKHPVTSRQELPDGQLQITTEYIGKDNNKQALIKNSYIIGASQFIIRKEVKFDGDAIWLMRNEYKYGR